MNGLEQKLKLSLVWLTLNKLAKELEAVDAEAAKVVAYAARVLALVK